MTQADVKTWMKELSNWGRWGEEDQLGTINLITPQKRKKAARLVTEGVSVSLARDAEKEKAIDNPEPFGHKMIPSDLWSSDNYSVSYHGYAHTHIDSLCHLSHQGKLFNGFAKTEVTTQAVGKLAITNLKNGIFTRGILMDIVRSKEVAYLEPTVAIYPEDLEALGEAAEKRRRWEFLLTASPISIGDGTGSPLNPITTF